MEHFAGAAGDPALAGDTPVRNAPIISPVLLSRPWLGVTRDQLTVPICRAAVLSDDSLYDSPSGPGVFYVPRWRVVEPSGSVPQITLQQSATDWTMIVRLEPYAAPAIADQVAQALASSNDVVLRYTVVAAAGSGQGVIVQEVHPSSTVVDGVQLVVTFSGTDNADLDRLYGAMTDDSHGTVLVVLRTVTAAVVASGPTEPPIWSTVPIEAFPHTAGPVTDPFQAGLVQRVGLLDRPVQGEMLAQPVQGKMLAQPVQGEMLAQPVQGEERSPVIERQVPGEPILLPHPPLPGPGPTPLPGPGPTPPDQQRYWVRTVVLEDPSPFYYPADRYPSIYAGITTGTPTYARTRRYVSFNGQPFPYYQDPGEAARFYYLPDSFCLARTVDSPHVLMLQLDPQGIGGPMDQVSVGFGFVAMPYVLAERIAAAVEPLRAFAPGPYPPGVTGPLLQPLLVTPDALSLQLVTGDAAPSAAGAVLSLRTGVTGQLTLTLSQFQAAYNALFAGLALLTGNVVVNLGSAVDTETVPIALRAGTTWGPTLDDSDQPVNGASVQVTLTNATESPVRIDAATGFLWRDGPGQPNEIPAPVSGASAGPSALTLPVTVKAGDHLELTVAASDQLPGAGTLRGRVDASVTVLADPQAVWDSVFSHTVPALTQRSLVVRVTSDIFTARTTPSPRPALKAVTVTFGTGTVVSFDVGDVPASGASPFITKSAALAVSLRDYVLAAGGALPYTYRVSALTVDDQTVADVTDRTANVDILDVTLPTFLASG